MGRGASGNEDRGTFNNLIEKDKKFCINAFSFSISFSPLAGKFPRMGIPYYCDQQLRKNKKNREQIQLNYFINPKLTRWYSPSSHHGHAIWSHPGGLLRTILSAEENTYAQTMEWYL